MKAKELTSYWATPDSSRLTAKQLSLRLPIHVAAKISALCDIFPNKTRTQIIGDLLTTALDGIESSFESVEGRYVGNHPETGEEIYENIGKGTQYSVLVDKYEKELEQEFEQGSDK